MEPVCYACIQSMISWVGASVGGHSRECRTGHFLSSHLYIVYALSRKIFTKHKIHQWHLKLLSETVIFGIQLFQYMD
jgi:hypothetical protein